MHTFVPNYTRLPEAEANLLAGIADEERGALIMEQRQPHAIENSLVFRSMTMEDIPFICEIEQEAFTTPWTRGAFENELTNNQFAHYMIMDIEGEVAGYGGMWLIMEEAHVTNIAVKDTYRGRKLGESLLRELMKTSAFLGAIRITLEVEPRTMWHKIYTKS